MNVTCLCVTHNRSRLLPSVIEQFDAQTYEAKRLLFLTSLADPKTVDYLQRIDRPDVRTIVLPEPLPFGTMRRLSVEAADTEYVANWDDDDSNHPERLEAQLIAIAAWQKPACALERVTLEFEGERIISHRRPAWEMTIVARKDVLKYPDVEKHEDTPAVYGVKKLGLLTLLDSPHLYTYRYTPQAAGPGSMNREHWLNTMDAARKARGR